MNDDDVKILCLALMRADSEEEVIAILERAHYWDDHTAWRNYGDYEGFTFEQTFTYKEHGEFFRGAHTMAGLRYTGDFYELLQRYGTIKVTITKFQDKVESVKAG
jgi:hypothetical protein